jgi:hypothetical protein
MALFFSTDVRLQVGSPSFEMRSWDDELIAVATDGSNKVWRFAHMHDYETSNYFSVPFAHVSPDGRYAMFNSNWGGTLGTDPQGQGDGKRIDVFLVELNQQYPVPAVDSVPPSAPVLPTGIAAETLSGIVNATAVSTDNVGVVAMRYAIDGTWQPKLPPPFTYVLDTTKLTTATITSTCMRAMRKATSL